MLYIDIVNQLKIYTNNIINSLILFPNIQYLENENENQFFKFITINKIDDYTVEFNIDSYNFLLRIFHQPLKSISTFRTYYIKPTKETVTGLKEIESYFELEVNINGKIILNNMEISQNDNIAYKYFKVLTAYPPIA